MGIFTIIKNSNDYYAIEFGKNIHDIFKSYRDTILIIDDKEENFKFYGS